jgi:hypothetical protein
MLPRSEQETQAMNILRGIGCVLLAIALMPAAARAQTSAAVPAGVKRVAPERLGSFWLLDPESAQANVPNSGYGLDAPTCAAVSYVVENSGATSHVKLEKIAPEGPLGKVALNVVRGMRFAAAPQNAGKEAVFTYVVMPFNLPDPASTKPADRAERTRVLDACKLADFLPPGK